MSRRRLLALLVPLLALCALTVFADAGAYEGTSLYDNISPEGQTNSSLIERYPTVNYGLDWHSGDVVTTTDLGLFAAPSGVDSDAAGAGIMHRLANGTWSTIRFVSSAVITLFTFAFSLDLLTGATGALAPVSAAALNLYDAIGTSWLALAIGLLGAWAMWRALVQRQYTRTFSQIGLSLFLVIIAITIVTQSAWTIGGLSKFSNEVSLATLGAVNGDSHDNAKTAAADALFETLIYDPWVVLTFGGLEHCVDADNKPVKPSHRDCKTRINHEKKYAERWLKAGAPGSKARDLEYKAIAEGKTPSASAIDDADVPANTFDGYHLSDADKPAVDIQQKDIADDRFGMALILFVGQLGAWLLIGGLSIGVILAQVIALLLFAFAPLMVLAALFPGSGHRAFTSWGEKLFFAITRKIWYGLILAVVLMIAGALTAASANLGWLFAFGLQATFFWSVFLFRKEAYAMINRAVGGTGSDNGRGLGERAMKAYYMSRMAKPLTRALGGAGGAATAGAAGAAKGAVGKTRDAGGRVRDNVNATVAGGHTERMIDSATVHAQAYDELKREHTANARRLRDENARRTRIDELQRRQRDARDGLVPDAASLALSPTEQRELERLQGRRMDTDAYEGLRDTVTDIDRRSKDSDNPEFPEELVAARAAQIRARKQDADYTRRTGNGHGHGSPRRTDDMRDLAERARRYSQEDHPKMFGDDGEPPAWSSRGRTPPLMHPEDVRKHLYEGGPVPTPRDLSKPPPKPPKPKPPKPPRRQRQPPRGEHDA